MAEGIDIFNNIQHNTKQNIRQTKPNKTQPYISITLTN